MNEAPKIEKKSETPVQDGVCALCSLWDSCKDLEKCLIDGKYFFEKFEDEGIIDEN